MPRMLALWLIVVGWLALGTTAAASSPQSTPPATDQRFALPAAGVAVTMPAGWEVRTDLLDSVWQTVLTARAPDASGRCSLHASHQDRRTARDVAESIGSTLLGARLLAPTGETVAFFEPFEVADVRLRFDGEAVRLQAPSDGSVAEHVIYVLDGSDRKAWLWCVSMGASPPDDLWIAIADTIEFLPAESASSPSR